MKRLLFGILTLVLCLGLAGCGASASSASSEAVSSEVVSEAAPAESAAVSTAEDAAAAIAVTFTVTGANGESTVLTATDGEKLSDALAAAGVISAEEAAAGFVTVVNGEEADYNADGAWWCLTDAAGEMTTVGVADIELHDGDSYAFTYTK